MVINSAQMQKAGKEFMLFQPVSLKQDMNSPRDSFSAIFGNMTGTGTDPRADRLIQKDSIKDSIFRDNSFNDRPVKETAAKKVFSEKADMTAEKKPVANVGKDDDETSESFIEKAASFLFQVTVTVTVVIEVSMDELKNGMQELGLKPQDLLNADSRYELFVNLKADGDAANLLTDNSLIEKLNTMENKIADIFMNEGITPESFEKVFESVTEEVAETVDAVMTKFMNTVSQDESNGTKEIKTSESTETVVVDGIENVHEKVQVVSSEAQNDTDKHENTDSSKKENTKVKPMEVTNKFVDHLVNTFEMKFSQMKVTEITNVPDIREIVNQIMEQVKIHVNNANTSIEIQLTPAALGKVQVSVEDNNGILTAKFQTESRVAKEAIESNLIQFKETLAEQGIKVDSVEVTVGHFDLSSNSEGKGNGQEAESHGKKHFAMDEINGSAKGSTEDLKEQAYIESGTSTVSFSA